jgi:RHS repeat-associated protein
VLVSYYPFGMQMVGRKYNNGSGYRYGFNGKENDNDVKGEGNQQDYGMRIYDPRLGRFLSVDPITKEYPELTPYQFASNRPIDGIDQDGLEWCPSIPKFPTNQGHWSDYTGAICNGVINVANLVPELWNSGVSTVKSLQKGTYLNDLGGEFKQMGTGVKNWAVNEYNYTISTPFTQQLKDAGNTLTSPQTLENVSTFLVGSKIPVGGGKGNLLKAETSTTTAAKTLIKADATAAVETRAAQFAANKSNGAISESIVHQSLKSQLGANEAILSKPRIYIGNGSSGKYAIPDFAVYNTKTGNFVKLIDAKDGAATLSKAQQQVNQYGGTFRGSSRAPKANAQKVAPNSIKVERTNVAGGG